MPGRYRPSPIKDFPPLLHRLVRAAEAECPPVHAEALGAFIALALTKQPAHGIVDCGARGESGLHLAIETIAQAHFEVDEALASFRGALKAANLALEPRDDIDGSAGRVQSESDAAYFYAGLAFGLVFAGPYERISSTEDGVVSRPGGALVCIKPPA